MKKRCGMSSKEVAEYSKEYQALRRAADVTERQIAEMRAAMQKGNLDDAWTAWEEIGTATRIIRQ